MITNARNLRSYLMFTIKISPSKQPTFLLICVTLHVPTLIGSSSGVSSYTLLITEFQREIPIFLFTCIGHKVATHSLTYGAEPFLRTANCAANQELPSSLWNPKVHYRVHKSSPLVPILILIDPIHIILYFLSKIHFNIVHTLMSWSS
jgi:hypothetical protein